MNDHIMGILILLCVTLYTLLCRLVAPKIIDIFKFLIKMPIYKETWIRFFLISISGNLVIFLTRRINTDFIDGVALSQIIIILIVYGINIHTHRRMLKIGKY